MDGLPADPLSWLRLQLRKQGVALGGLPWAQQRLALAWVWAGLPLGQALNERAVNGLLQAQLSEAHGHEEHGHEEQGLEGQGAACWLRTDHVELRRWLVDAGLLQRDGFGRVYQRTAPDRLPAAWDEALQAVAHTLSALDTAAWASAERAAHQARRAQAQATWRAQQGRA